MASSSSNPDLGTYQVANGVEIPNMRTVEDFILDKARFEAPPLNDLPRWNNRIISNLLYYQTNYFVVIAVIFALSSVFNAKDLVIGLTAVIAILTTAVYALSPNTVFVNTRRDHPILTLVAIVGSLYYLFYVFPSVLILVFSLLLPLAFVLIHASTRLRNFRAKINQAAEKLGLKQTVMGKVLDAIGCDVKA